MHFTCILNIDIALFCKYHINIVSQVKKWHRSITSRHRHAVQCITSRYRVWYAVQWRILRSGNVHTSMCEYVLVTTLSIWLQFTLSLPTTNSQLNWINNNKLSLQPFPGQHGRSSTGITEEINQLLLLTFSINKQVSISIISSHICVN